MVCIPGYPLESGSISISKNSFVFSQDGEGNLLLLVKRKELTHGLREHLPSLDFAGRYSQLKHWKKAQGVLGDVSSLHSCSYCHIRAQVLRERWRSWWVRALIMQAG